MSYYGIRNFGLEASLGKVTGYSTVNKFGKATDCDNGIPTDIWDGADGATSTDIWVPPTAARVHTIVSSSDVDSDAGGSVAQGAGARTVRISYLPDWDTAETTADVVLDGTTGVTMPAAVMIHRMRVLTWGANGVNAGIIKATAATDTTITAMIAIGENQTQMCIYGIPSTQKLRVGRMRCDIVSGLGQTRDLDGEVLFMPDPATNAATNTAWVHKEHFTSVESNAPWIRDYGDTPKKFDGPGILKLQVSTNTNDTAVIATFDGWLVTT